MRRRELFSSLASSFFEDKKEVQEIIIRPPYFEDRTLFHKECPTCDGKCATFCEEDILIIQDDKTPKLDFSNNGCTYCDKCAQACDKNVLTVENKKKIEVKIEIDILKCVSWHDTMCFSCKDPCIDDAIEFIGIFKPSINEDKCTNCGFCIKVCPSEAITVKGVTNAVSV